MDAETALRNLLLVENLHYEAQKGAWAAAHRVVDEIDRLSERAVPQGFGPRTAVRLLAEASKTGDPGVLALVAQLANAQPCAVCNYVHFACRCAASAAQGEPSTAQRPPRDFSGFVQVVGGPQPPKLEWDEGYCTKHGGCECAPEAQAGCVSWSDRS